MKRPYLGPIHFDAILQMKPVTHETALFGTEPFYATLTSENGDKRNSPLGDRGLVMRLYQ